MIRLSQETIAIIGVFVTLIGVSVALGALIITTTNELRGEIQAVRAEGRADRETIQDAPTGKPYGPKDAPTGKPYGPKDVPTGRHWKSAWPSSRNTSSG